MAHFSIIQTLNYLTSKQVVRNMSASGSRGKPEPWGTLANLWRLMQSVMDESAPALEGLGLSIKTFFLLTNVEEVPFPAELARRMHLPPPTITYMIKQLESLGFIKRQAEPGDLRKFRLVLTPAGKKAITQGHEAMGVVVAKRLSRISREDASAFDRIVSAIAGDQKTGL